MKLVELALSGWRNLSSQTIQPSPTTNVIHGGNGQGKTNLIEAIHYLASLKSFRARRLAHLVQWGAPGFRIRARCEVGGVPQTLEVRFAAGGRTLAVDGAPVSSPKDYFQGFTVVLFTPNHLSLVQGEPAGRRRFLDRAVFGIRPAHLELVRRYNKLLASRNAALKRPGRLDEPLMESLEEQLAEAGAGVMRARQAVVADIQPLVREAHHGLAGDDDKPVDLLYHSRVGSAEAGPLLELLRGKRGQDQRRGFTSVGPHQDDLKLILGDRDARHFSSQGEARSLVIALKFAEAQWLSAQRGEPPVVLLDDIGSELDARRRDHLFSLVDSLGVQAFVTTVALGLVPLGAGGRAYHLAGGRLADP